MKPKDPARRRQNLDYATGILMKTKIRVEEVWPQAQLRAYFNGGRSPYPKALHHPAKKESDYAKRR